MTHVRVWQFQPAPGRESDFVAAYSGGSVWAKLFDQAEGFVGTTLLTPIKSGGPYLTLDRWESLGAFERFQDVFGDAYRRLDITMETLTAGEVFIGAFDNRS
ncbi:antibiotic biosynthesis monooxygenase [Sphingomonas sp.]|uniref:antibiotic biosynthesis monooxygenase family protein n=1 Tax=Sphingomonas sp. TaxID=28214 RepID=UPI00286C3846|nr:antibiotic biosynthesis monooxygenase [Sphingomonas sp.]